MIPGGELLTLRTWDFRARRGEMLLADSQPLIWYEMPQPPGPPRDVPALPPSTPPVRSK